MFTSSDNWSCLDKNKIPAFEINCLKTNALTAWGLNTLATEKNPVMPSHGVAQNYHAERGLLINCKISC